MHRTSAVGTTVVAAQFVNYTGASGEQRVSSGFPLPPGLVTQALVDARALTLTVNGVERPCVIRALRGLHQDGSLRSVEVQCLHTFPDASETPVPAVELHIGRVRQSVDLPYVPLVHARFLNPCVVLPTDPAYLCTTWLTMQPLVPDSTLSGLTKEYFDDFFDFLALDPINIGNGIKPGRLQTDGSSAHYAHTRGLMARYCMSGNPHYWRWAGLRFTNGFYWNRIATPATGFSGAPYFNPEAVSNMVGSSEAQEWHRFTIMDFPALYWATGYGYLWNSVSNMAMRPASYVLSNTYANVALGTYVADPWWGIRFNVTRAATWLAAYVMDATGQPPVGTAYSGGIPRATPTDLRSLLAWCVEAWDRNRWTSALGAYREGLRGATMTACDGEYSAPGTPYPGALTLFQVAAATFVFMDLYLNFKDCVDPVTSETTKERVRDNLKVAIRNTGLLKPGDVGYGEGPNGTTRWGIPYIMTEIPGRGWATQNGQVTKHTGFVGGGTLLSVSTDVGAQVGTWQVECTNATVPATFQVRRPDTTVEGTATVGVSYNGAINFTLEAVGTAFAVGDRFNVLLAYTPQFSLSPNLLPMFARAAAWCAHYWPTETVTDLDGVAVTYQQFYERCVDPDNLRNSVTYDIQYEWKTFGEYFGFQMDTPYLLAHGVPAAPASPRATVNYADQLWSHV